MSVTGRGKVAGVMGWPVAHSKSPLLHGYWLARYGIDGAYVPLPVRPDDLESALDALPRLGFAGVNLTIPHKEKAFALLRGRCDGAARAIGAVNTVVVGEDGTLEGRNTDAHGFIANLKTGAPQWNVSAPAVVIGAGGAARAVVYALVAEGVRDIRLINRTPEKAKALAQAFEDGSGETGIRIHAFKKAAQALEGAGLLVNATSLGMEGQPPLELDLAALPGHCVVNDLVYAPLETGLLKAARPRGLATVDGLGMLLHQAAPAFEAWFGVKPAVTPELRAALIGD